MQIQQRINAHLTGEKVITEYCDKVAKKASPISFYRPRDVNAY